MAMHHVVLILSVCRVWHFNLCSVKRKGEKKKGGEGRKVCITGREEVNGDLGARLDCRTEPRLHFAPLRCARLQKVLTEISPAFPTLLSGRGTTAAHLGSEKAEQYACQEDNAAFHKQLIEGVAREMRNTVDS